MPVNREKINYVYIVAFLSLFFLVLSLGYAQSYNPGFFPDEFAHMGYVLDVIKNNFPDYVNGVKAFDNKLNYLNHPALYYVLVGEIVNILHLQSMYADVGRYFNMLISILVIIVTCRMLYSATESKLAVLLGGAFLLTVPMFVILGGAVNNDQLNILGCSLVISGLYDLIESHKKNKSLSSAILFICIGGLIAALSKATGALVVLCMLISIVCLNFLCIIAILKKIRAKQWGVIFFSLTIVFIYYICIYNIYGEFYPAPQPNGPTTWFAIDNPMAQRLSLPDFIISFYQSNLFTLSQPYGHVTFIDSDIRIFLFKTILIMLGIMTLYMVIRNLSSTTKPYNILLSFIVAFGLYIALYFYTIRQMHMNTGYPGAMQARYFFGFLPVFSLMIATLISKINNKSVIICISVLILSGLIASVYPAFIKFSDVHRWQSMTVIEQPSVNTNYGPLVKSRKFEQEILAQSNSIKGVALLLGTYARNNHGHLTLDLSDEDGKIIASSFLKLDYLKDNSYAWFDLKRTPLVEGQKYIMKLSCNECVQDNAITWWANKNEIELPIFLLNNLGPSVRGLYPEGDAYVDGLKVNSGFTFKIYF
jgi:hypothetical protein